MTLQVSGQVLANENIAPQHFLMEIEIPQIANRAKPGQFVHIRVSDNSDPLLRRPISLHRIDKEKGSVYLLYQVVGRGTELMSHFVPGQKVDLMGPLGNGFTLPEAENVTVIGGGIGVAPLFPLLSLLIEAGKKITVIFGARNKDYLLGIELVREMGLDIHTATDDGSVGHHGFVTDIFSQENQKIKPDYVYACGPEPMLAKVTEIAKVAGIPGEVSLEERMGCGVGACLSCVCKIKTVNDNGFKYKKVCQDGPVFNLQEVIFHGQG